MDVTDDEPVEQENFSQPEAESWHGMMTSCVAAGNGFKSGYLYRGIASRASLVLVKAGHPRKRGILEIDIQRALTWVIANQERFNIRVINISLGGDYPPRGWQLCDLDQKVELAVARGMVVVTAAGNSGIERLLPPATAPSAITVGGLDDRDSQDPAQWRMYHSNYGEAYRKHAKPEVIAPAIWLSAPMLPGTDVHKEGIRLWQNAAFNQFNFPFLVGIAGLIFIPWTTLMYTMIFPLNSWDWLWLGLAIAADIFTWTSGGYKRKSIPYYPSSAP